MEDPLRQAELVPAQEVQEFQTSEALRRGTLEPPHTGMAQLLDMANTHNQLAEELARIRTLEVPRRIRVESSALLQEVPPAPSLDFSSGPDPKVSARPAASAASFPCRSFVVLDSLGIRRSLRKLDNRTLERRGTLDRESLEVSLLQIVVVDLGDRGLLMKEDDCFR